MDSRQPMWYPMLPQIGCAVVFVAMLGMCVMPLVLVDVMQSALFKLHLSAGMAFFVMAGIFLGGLINVPIYRFRRDDLQSFVTPMLPGMLNWMPAMERGSFETVLAVNIGGCLIPLAVALYEVRYVLNSTSQAEFALAAAVLVSIAACYQSARVVPGIGIVMPGFIAPLTAVGVTWLLLGWGDDYATIRAPIAFIAGVLGPIVGADLLHLRDINRVPASVVSIGGAGTFDGIVLSGILAAFLA